MQDPTDYYSRTTTRKPWYQKAIEVDNNFRKPWYQKAIEMATASWKSTSRSGQTIIENGAIYRNWHDTMNPNKKLRKCTSLRVATRVCLCAPISSYEEVFQADSHARPHRRSNSYPRSSKLSNSNSNSSRENTRTALPSARISVEGRKIFRGKSVTDNELMRRFVIEEEAMMQVRRRNEMEIIKRRSGIRKRKLGPSPLSRMSASHKN